MNMQQLMQQISGSLKARCQECGSIAEAQQLLNSLLARNCVPLGAPNWNGTSYAVWYWEPQEVR